MLLSLMRKHAKSWLIKVLIGIIAIVFIFYFGYSFTAKRALRIATVNGEFISVLEYQKAYRDLMEGLRRQYKSIWNDNLIELFNIKNRAMDGLINQKLISQEARRLGLDVTEEGIQKAIMDYSAFQIDGRFDLRRYQSLLNQNRMKPEDFEESIAKSLLEEKLRQFLFTFMTVTEQELLDHYTFNNEKIKIRFVYFEPETFKKSVSIDPSQMETYFDEHKEAYRVPLKIKILYILIDPAAFGDGVKPTEKEIRDYYEYNTTTFMNPKQIRARHILFKLEQGADDAQEKKVKEKAESVLAEARQDKDFAELAKAHSEGPTQSKGGDLGYFSSGKMVKPFEDVAFNLKIGEISDLVRTSFGYHIIKVEDIKEAKPKPLTEVREKIVDTLIKHSSGDLAHEKALSLLDQMPYDVDLSKYAVENGMKAQETGYFAQNEPIPDLGGDAKLRDILFAMEKGETSEVNEVNGKFYIFQVSDIKDSFIPEMASVTDKVKDDTTSYLAAEEAKKAAEAYLAALKDGKDWVALSKEKERKIEETDFFTRRDAVPNIGYDADLSASLFGLKADSPYPEKIFNNNKGSYVIQWAAYKEIDPEAYKKDREETRDSLTRIKHSRAYQNWIESLKANAEIEIDQSIFGE